MQMNALEAVEVVLADAGEPLGYREITRRVLEQGLWQTKGLTPEATIHARLAVDIKDLGMGSSPGVGSRFQRTGPGVFALRKWGLPEVAARGAKPNKTKEAAAVAAGPGESAGQSMSAVGAVGPGYGRATVLRHASLDAAQVGQLFNQEPAGF
jgi:hypothetical protein